MSSEPGTRPVRRHDGGDPPLSAVEALFHGALERPEGSRRDAWLRAATGNDEALLEQVRDLLEAHASSTDFLERGPLLGFESPVEAEDSAPLDVDVGATVGPYTLIERLGEGGFGVVYRAEQSEPVRREVAFKVIKLGMDTRQVIARFEAERQALARLDHPSIARVLDAGQTEGGRPYFVMDLVPGIDFTSYCDRKSLSVRGRCELFLELCGAVQHAHQRGIIHRDLKPSNVLVAEGEDRGLPKVIDFGIAKATADDRDPGEPLRTELGQVIGTPVYMSPEQALGQGDIDTRSDVYSLGVIFYELLTGGPPIEAQELREHAVAGDLASFLAHRETALPSAAFMGRADISSLAPQRGGSASEVRAMISGDLDFIALQALAHERERRYESAASFARDIQHALADRPIQARPPSTTYRFRKFLRRHRVAAAAASAAMAALLIGLVVAFDAQRAKQAQADVITAVFTEAMGVEFGRRTADGVQRQAEDAFGANHPFVVDALSTHADRLARSGDLDGALEARRRALEVAERAHGPRSVEVKFARSALGMQLARIGDPAAAEEQLTAAIDLDSALSPPGTPFLNAARLEVAALALDEGDLQRAEALATSANEIASALAPTDRRMRADVLEMLIDVLVRAGADELAREAWSELFRVLERLSTPQSTALPREHLRCGRWLASIGKSGEAALELRRAIDGLAMIDKAPRELEYAAVRAFNEVASSARVPRAVLDDAMSREFELVSQIFERGTGPYHDALRSLAERHKERGEAALELSRLLDLHASMANASGAEGARRQLARQLGERAVALRVADGLGEDDYRVGCDAVAVALTVDPNDPALELAQIELLARAGDRLKVFALVEELGRRPSFDERHPVFLAVKAVAYTSSPVHGRKANTYLEEALTRSLQPEFMAVPGLQKTLSWARSIVLDG